MVDIGKSLKKLREENHYTQDYLADYLHVGRSTYANWERNRAFPDYDKLVALCILYNVSADYFLNVIDSPTSFVEKSTRYPSLTEDDVKILSYYHRLDEENQDYIRGMMIKLYKEQISEKNDMKNSNIG